MDEQGILLMSEQLREALGEKVKSVESDPLPGRWSRSFASDPGPDEIHISGRVSRCAVVKGGGIRLVAYINDATQPADVVKLVDRSVPVRIHIDGSPVHVSVSGRVRSVRVDGGEKSRVSILIDPAA
jgi:hypothetical protein